MVRKIRYNEQLLAEIKRCQFDLAMAMRCASRGRYDEAYNAAMGWARRVRFLRNMKRASMTLAVRATGCIDASDLLRSLRAEVSEGLACVGTALLRPIRRHLAVDPCCLAEQGTRQDCRDQDACSGVANL
jgi:hypothetical protein